MFTRLKNTWRLYHMALGDKRTPMLAKLLPLATILYLLWPMDILPDAIPVFGQLDDVGVLVMLFWQAWHITLSTWLRTSQKSRTL